MLSYSFTEEILIDPIKQGADCLKIITGYATHTMASWHLKEINEYFSNHIQTPIKIIVLIGMCNYDGLSKSVHNGFKQLVNENSKSDYVRLQAQYIYKGTPVHSKVYLWERAGLPFCAFIGSANYTQASFLKFRREIMTRCNATEASEYFNMIEADSIYCNHYEVEEYITLHPIHPILTAEENKISNLRDTNIPNVTLSFITKTGETGIRSGINWGQRSGREPNQAYIPLPSHIAKTGFFPLNKQHFSVITDDDKQLILRVEQQNDKAITTPSNNSLLGEYFRNRLGLSNGAYVMAADFERYGRNNITFYKLDDEQFFMDFSV